jgi:hypothetical protein
MTNQAKKLTKRVRVSGGKESHIVERGEAAVELMDQLYVKYNAAPTVDDVPDDEVEVPRGTPQLTLTSVEPVKSGPRSDVAIVTSGAADHIRPPKVNSDFMGALIVDDDARKRIEAQHEVLRQGGLNVKTSEQFFETGTRMANMGYETQHGRKQEHDKLVPFAEAAEALRALVETEARHDEQMTARDLAEKITVKNGRVFAFEHALTEQAIRGLMSLLPRSKALGYALGLRDRAAEEYRAADKVSTDPKFHSTADGIRALGHADALQLAGILRYECTRFGDRTLKLRMRKNPGDIFAIVSQSFAPADAPEVIKQILPEMAKDVKGSFMYDAESTQWELRAEVFTPTPVDEQAVGEPFRGYTTFQARDNGTSRFRGGGGVELLRCLNASVYIVEGSKMSRVHRGDIMVDVAAMAEGAQSAIHTLCKAWGTNREIEIPLPEVEGEKLTIQQAIPGFYRFMLTNPRSEVRTLMKGRTEDNVETLTNSYFEQRRVSDRIVRSDFAQGLTWAIQDLDAAARRDAEIKVGNWLVKHTNKLLCELRESNE